MNPTDVISRHRNRDGVVVFPGSDPRRDVELKQFLDGPVDFRAPFRDVEFANRPQQFAFRQSGPSDEIKQDWEQRLVRVRAATRMMFRRPISRGVPDIARREFSKLQGRPDPYNRQPVEVLADERKLRMQGAMYAAVKLPKLRQVSDEVSHARLRERNRIF
jgi:hypothetical protein